jgi:hypothetical protein
VKLTITSRNPKGGEWSAREWSRWEADDIDGKPEWVSTGTCESKRRERTGEWDGAVRNPNTTYKILNVASLKLDASRGLFSLAKSETNSRCRS